MTERPKISTENPFRLYIKGQQFQKPKNIPAYLYPHISGSGEFVLSIVTEHGGWVSDLLKIDKNGYLCLMKTSIPEEYDLASILNFDKDGYLIATFKPSKITSSDLIIEH